MSKVENIYQKLNNFRSEVGAIRKDKTNPYHKSKYADINDVIESVREPLSNVGLIDVDTIKKDENGLLWLNTKLVNIDNPEEFLEIETPLLIKDKNNPQALGSALTYCRRYNRVTLLGLEQEDDDGNTAAGLDKNKYPEPKNNSLNKSTQSKETIRTKFMQAILTAGLKKEDLADFTKWMNALKYDLRDDNIKIKLLNNLNELKQLVTEYLEEKKVVEAMGG
jgi:hypothetical protein